MHSYDGATALSLAVMAGQTNICSILTRHGACPLDQSSDSEEEEDDDDVEDEEEDGYVECDSCNLNEEVVEKKSNSCLNSVPKDNHVSLFFLYYVSFEFVSVNKFFLSRIVYVIHFHFA